MLKEVQTVNVDHLMSYLKSRNNMSDYRDDLWDIKDGYTGFLKNHLVEYIVFCGNSIKIFAYEFHNEFEIEDGVFSGEEYEGHFLKIIKNEILTETSVV